MDKSQKLLELLKKNGPMSRSSIREKADFNADKLDLTGFSCKKKNITSFTLESTHGSKVSVGCANKNTIYYIFNYHSRAEIIEALLESFPRIIENSEKTALKRAILLQTSQSEKEEVREVLNEKLN